MDNRTLSNKVFTNSTATLEMVTTPRVNPCENILDLISDHDTILGNTVIMHTTLESILFEISRAYTILHKSPVIYLWVLLKYTNKIYCCLRIIFLQLLYNFKLSG